MRITHAADEEDIAHILLRCTAYTHRSALHKQIADVKRFYPVQWQQQVDEYFNTDLTAHQRCAHMLSRTLPIPTATLTHKHDQRKWQAMWYTIFHKLDHHIHVLVTRRDSMLLSHKYHQLQQSIKHNR